MGHQLELIGDKQFLRISKYKGEKFRGMLLLDSVSSLQTNRSFEDSIG